MAKPEQAGLREEPGAAVGDWARQLIAKVEESYYGNRTAVELCLVALLCRGHLLIEDLPGVGKTVLARGLARSIGGKIRRIQCTPDLLPTDILGVSVYDQGSGGFRFREGPIMTNTLLVDEINRATPRTQSALLEAMAEGQVSVESRTIRLPNPFFVVATQSPLESEGTFPLPEVQKDRFFLTLGLGYPDRDDERRIIAEDEAVGLSGQTSEETAGSSVVRMQELATAVYVSEEVQDYLLALVGRTRADNRLTIGVSPRGSLALYKGSQALAGIKGRDWVAPEDVKAVASPVLRGRILVKPEYAARGLTPGGVVEELLQTVEAPGYKE